MPWTTVSAVGLATAGLLMLGWCALRVWLAVQRLARELDTASRAVAQAGARLEQAVAPLTDAVAAAAPQGTAAGAGHRTPPGGSAESGR